METKEMIIKKIKDLQVRLKEFQEPGSGFSEEDRIIMEDTVGCSDVEEKLQEDEQKLRIIYDNSSQLIGLLSPEGILLEANKTATDFAGVDFSCIKNKLFWETPWWSHSAIEQEKLRQAINKAASGKPVNFETTHIAKDGTLQNIDFSLTPILNRNGKVIFLMPASYVITGRKKAEEELRLSTTLVNYLSNYANDFIILLDENFRFLKVNERMINFYGYSEEELLRMHAVEIRAPGTREEFAQQVKLAQVSGKALFETMHQRKDGTQFPVEINLRSIDSDGKRFYQAVIRDISERKKMEIELKRKTAFLESQVEAGIDGILIIDKQGQRILVNRRLLEMWDVPEYIRDDQNDEPLLQYVVSRVKNPEQFLNKVKYLYSHQDETSRDEIEFEDGSIFDRYSSPVKGGDGTYFGRIWTFRDITERKKAEKEAQKRIYELEIFYKASIGREERVLELKKKVEELEARLEHRQQ